MAADLQGVATLLQASLDPRQHKQAEAAIREQETKPGFSLSLLQIVASENFQNTSRLASALYFKNFIKRNWIDEDGKHILPQDEVSSIKRELVGLMISVPSSMQAQLGDAISVIADSDFWQRWDTLVDDLVSRLTPDNVTVNNGVLQVGHSIFKRWRPLYRSDDLFTEINLVLGKFSEPFMGLFQNTDNLIQQNQNNPEVLKQQFSTLNIALKLVYDLSSQDLPPVFEDNMQGVCALLDRYLSYDNPLLRTDDDAEAGPLEYAKAGIFEILRLWVTKYEDAISSYVGQFVNSSWNLLTTLGPETKYDILTSRALGFLTSISAVPRHAANFNNEGTLRQVVEKVIVPNLALRESDVEMFEDEPIEFTRRDLEGTDSDTRRRAATDFLRRLMEQFQQLVTETVNVYIDHYLKEYNADRSSNWKSKDTAVYLFCSIAPLGAITASQGATTINPYVNVLDFFQANIAEDLVSESSHVILQVDALKYLYMFRSQLNPAQWQQAFPMVVKHLGSTNYVVYTYSSIVIERVLSLNTTSHDFIPRTTLTPLAKDILQRLFLLVERDTAPEKIQENEFLMRCVMKVLIVIKEDVVPFTDFVLTNFINIIRVIRHNPSNPRFYYYLFESVGALIRFAAPSQPEKMENALYGPFAEILSGDVQEFTPYVFQLFAALLEANLSGSLSEFYKNLIQPVLMPSLWDSRGNTPALVRLLSSLISRGAADMAAANQLEPVLGIFQKLISQKWAETYGFDLLETVISHFPPPTLQKYFPTIFNLLFTRLEKSRTEMFVIRFVRLYHFMSAKTDQGLGTDFVINIFDQIQSGVFTGIYLTIILPDTQKLSRPADRKLAVVSLTKTLANSAAFSEKYAKGWGFTCEALLKLMLNPPLPQTTDDLIPDQDVDDVGFGVGFTQLNTCRRAAKDPYPEVDDVKVWISQYLKQADQEHGGRITSYTTNRLSPETRSAFVAYMQG